MGKKRKVSRTGGSQSNQSKTKYDIEDKFDDTEDEFYAGRDKILLDEQPTLKRQRLVQEQEKDIQPSDEEVLEYAATDDDDFDDAQSVDEEDGDDVEEEDERNWGTTKADYYNADMIETEADALDEEKEARRLQQKQLKSMTDADFGFDELSWTQSDTKKISSRPVTEKLPEAQIPAGAKEEELAGMLYQRYPEFKLLARDLVELQDSWTQFQTQAIISGHSHDGVTTQTKLIALTSYLGAIAMYFAVVTSKADPTAETSKITSFPPNELREHTVIENLISSRQLWDAVKDLKQISTGKKTTSISNHAEPERIALPKVNGTKPKSKLKRVASPESDVSEILELPELPKKTKKQKKLLDLSSLLAQSAMLQQEEDLDFGDEGPLNEQEAAEKARKKKSLRFYTSQIAQKANRRGAASRDAGGDDDVPRKERLRDKQERLLQEAERRGQQKATAEEELGGQSEDDVQSQQGDEYYQSLVAESKLKKSEKKAKADAYAEAARQGAQVYEEEQVGEAGKRRITYAIEKNKGLAPKRKKDVRNPRVKKRKKYDEKMKKLGSIRQVYKGGEGRGGYAGELTGIKTNVVKSIKL